MREYRILNKKCESEVKNAVKEYEKDIANNAKKNSKLVYSYMNSKKAIKDTIRGLNYEKGKRVEDPCEIVKILNNQFKSVFEKDNDKIPDVSSVRERVIEANHKSGEFDWGNVTDIDTGVIFNKLKNLNEFKAFGVDGVSNAVLKNCAESFVKPLKNDF